MTCDETRALLDTDPTTCTTAERVAVIKHCVGCESCSRLVTERVESIVRRLTQEDLDLVMRLASKDVVEMANRDFKDPEGARGVLGGGKGDTA